MSSRPHLTPLLDAARGLLAALDAEPYDEQAMRRAWRALYEAWGALSDVARYADGLPLTVHRVLDRPIASSALDELRKEVGRG